MREGGCTINGSRGRKEGRQRKRGRQTGTDIEQGEWRIGVYVVKLGQEV